MTHKRSITKGFSAGFVGLLCMAEPVLAADQLSIIGGAGLELHDNAALQTKKASDLIRVANADIGYKKPEGMLTADIDYRAERRDYLHNTQSDQNSINGNAALLLQIVPRQLDAVLYHQISQQMTDRRGLDISSNREERSIVTAGVDGFLHFSPVDSVVLKPRFADVSFQHTTQSDSKRSTFAAEWDHKLGPVAALDLTGTYNHVTFDDSNNNYNSPSVMLEYHTALAHLSYQAAVGYNRLSREHGRDFSGATFKLGLDYKGDEGFSGGGTWVSQLTDSSIGLSTMELSNNDFRANDSNFQTPDTVQKDQLDIYLGEQINAANAVRFTAGYLREDYKETPRDQNIAYAQIDYMYTLNTRWSTDVNARFTRTKFLDDPKQKYDTTGVRASLIYHASKPLDIRFSIGQDKRVTDGTSNSYTDRLAIVGVNYRFL